ncbi:hypothetical protein BV25DRAFT_1836956 [Artomyces pyxidatus]|uniref:Uncharacterized protein n=1 Tax=Artomyces pyxidatus TaxID=48021 RepID=A0ACB8T729_9AGAM|nr:hypothetical protein BV25DRAFT_1836956 [Artomyces pyxidatus]
MTRDTILGTIGEMIDIRSIVGVLTGESTTADEGAIANGAGTADGTAVALVLPLDEMSTTEPAFSPKELASLGSVAAQQPAPLPTSSKGLHVQSELKLRRLQQNGQRTEASLATAKAEHDYQMAALESQMIQQRRERAEAQLAAAVAGKLGIDYVPKHRPVSPGPL